MTREAPKAENEKKKKEKRKKKRKKEKEIVASSCTLSFHFNFISRSLAHPPRELVNGLPGFRTLKPLSLRSSEKVMGKMRMLRDGKNECGERNKHTNTSEEIEGRCDNKHTKEERLLIANSLLHYFSTV